MKSSRNFPNLSTLLNIEWLESLLQLPGSFKGKVKKGTKDGEPVTHGDSSSPEQSWSWVRNVIVARPKLCV